MSAPPSYKDLASVVEAYLTKGDNVRGWLIDSKQDGAPNRLAAYPFASPKGVGVHLSLECPEYHTTFQSKMSAAFKSWREYLPTVIYHAKVNNTSNKIEVDAAVPSLKVTAKHPAFTANCKTALLDGFSTDANVTTRLSDKVYAGASLQYDPKRSGVRDFTTTIVRYTCPNIGNGDLLGQYSLRNGFSVHMRIPLHTYMDVAVMAEQKRFIAGVQTRSPCGGRFMFNTNVTDGTYTITSIRNMNDIWKITATMTAPFAPDKGALAPRFGLKFTHMDASD
ncbi:hypothetical protein JKF63_00790 [Porcisia hertigi]|uniref:Uncharacterized protein n=1 Tax=Porcisia hertigi TaxID=2761500 RepID=A0A836HZP8_9TRYP|nr:hypothetical protein JKF63_00790 [Porcisia hertigi]